MRRRLGRVRDRFALLLLGIGRDDLREIGTHLEGQAREIEAERGARLELQAEKETLAVGLGRTAADLQRVTEEHGRLRSEAASASQELARVGSTAGAAMEALRGLEK